MFATRTNWDLSSNRLSEVLAQKRASGEKLLDLTASNPTECGFEYDGHAIMRALCSPAALEYHPDPRGLAGARTAVQQYYAAHLLYPGVDDIFLTTSTSEAYSYVFRLLCNPGEEVLVPTPSYPLFDFLADVQDVKLVRYPLVYDHGWQIDLHALELAITPRTRAVVVVNPNNPTGHFLKRQEFEQLNQICSRHKLALIADEVFLDFALPSSGTAISLCGSKDVLTFTMSGLSKIAGLPQMKVAWLVVSGPQELKDAAISRLEVIADTYLSMNAPLQHALPELLGQRHAFREQILGRLRGNLAELDRQLGSQTQVSRLEIEGGWYAVLRVPATRSDADLALHLLQSRGVYVHPGHFYDFSGDGYLVVSLITPEKQFTEGARQLLTLIADAAGRPDSGTIVA